ncbi:hypothetical protein [Streptomyces sp. NRRL S-455]|uniref:hypothetical protein n=1 Tax=Streptomyces sp. NRRL S-455 TaxID=1463908 RepID=UPI0004C1AB64|nr:hypothetical protein [Streptomyces sp. NRRL S-455]
MATATHIYTDTAGSPYTITANYGGDANFAGSSGSDTQTVNQAATTATVSSSPDPSVVGESVTVTAAAVTFDFGDGSPTVNGTLSGGVATVTHPYATTTGSPFTITATYAGDGDFAGDTATDTQTVNQAATTATVSSSPDPSVVGESVTVTAAAGTTAATVSGGVATATHPYTTTTGSPFTITAAYGGDTDFAGDTATDTQVVEAA